MYTRSINFTQHDRSKPDPPNMNFLIHTALGRVPESSKIEKDSAEFCVNAEAGTYFRPGQIISDVAKGVCAGNDWNPSGPGWKIK